MVHAGRPDRLNGEEFAVTQGDVTWPCVTAEVAPCEDVRQVVSVKETSRSTSGQILRRLPRNDG